MVHGEWSLLVRATAWAPSKARTAKVKHYKRLMYEPANFDLPRKMALLN
jgi:hypothetical protein